jgi:hypothetical protein
MMICRVKAEVSAGDDAVRMEMRLPNGGDGPLPNGLTKFDCQLLSVHAQLAMDKMEYKVRLRIKREEHQGRTYSRFFVDPFLAGATTLTFADKVARFNVKAFAQFPFATAAPHLSLPVETEEEPERAWKVSLPPGSFLYVDSSTFWETLGFDSDLVTVKAMPLLGKNESVEVFGFFNDTAKVHDFISREVLGNEQLATLHGLLTGRVKVKERVTMELGWRTNIVYPLSVDGQRGLSNHEATHALSELVDKALRLASLDDRAIALSMSEDGDLNFDSKAIPDCPVTLELSPKFPLDEYLRSPGLRILFPMADDRSYSFKTRRVDQDPLEDHYPISIVCTNEGDANHFVPDLGYVALLGHLNSKDDCCRLPGLTLEGGDLAFLSLYFVDKNDKRLTFRENVNLHFVFELELSCRS